jgi:hypothetical protein
MKTGGSLRSRLAVWRTGVELDDYAALLALVLAVEFVRENLDFLVAFRALAIERFQMLEICESGTMFRGAHGYAPP